MTAFNRKTLLDAVSKLSGLTQSRGPKPILRNVLIHAEGDSAKVSATNLEQYVTLTIPCEGSLRCLVPADRLRQFLQLSAAESMTLTEDGGNLIAACDSRLRFPTENPDEFPVIPKAGDVPAIEIQGGALRAMIAASAFAAERNEANRYALEGVFFDASVTELCLVGTDGKRLAVSRLPIKGAERSCILPISSIRHLEKSLPDDSCQLRIDSNYLSVESPGAFFWSRLVEGRYPRWRDVIAGSFPSESFEIHAPSLLVAIQRASLACDENNIGVTLSIKDGSLNLSAESANGKAEASIPVATDQCVAANFDPDYLVDYLRLVGETTITVSLRSNLGSLFGNGKPDYVVMSLSLN